MKVIVNRNQYEKVISESRGYSKSVEKWGDYVTDELLPMILKQDVDEDVYSLKKLSLKLVNIFLKTKFEGGRHIKRVNKI